MKSKAEKAVAKAAKQLDTQIEQLYYKHAQGKNIVMTDIPKLYKDVRAAVITGSPVEDAVLAAIAKYCMVA